MDNDKNYILGEDGNFYYWDDDIEDWLLCSASEQNRLYQEMEDEERDEENAKNPFYNKEREERKEQERLRAIEMEDPTVILRDIEDEHPATEFQGGVSKKPKQTKHKRKNMTDDPSFEQIAQDIETFLDNLIKKEYEDVYRYERSFMKPHRGMASIDPNMVYPDYKLLQKERLKKKKKPLIFVYLDRSGSFSDRAKANLGSRLLNFLHDRYVDSGKIDMIVSKFHDDVIRISRNEYGSIETGGGTEIDKVIKDIATLKQVYNEVELDGVERIMNIIVITDSDSDSAKEYVEVNGGVWLIYCLSSLQQLQNHIIGTENRQYKFNNLDQFLTNPDEEVNDSDTNN